MIADFCVKAEDLCPSVGGKLIENIKREALNRGTAQILVVCGAHDELKRHFLKGLGLSIASEWYVGGINKTYAPSLPGI